MTLGQDEAVDQIEVSDVILDELIARCTLNARSLDRFPELDEIVGRRNRCQEPSSWLQNTSALRRIPASVHRRDQRHALVEQRKASVRIRDHPGDPWKPAGGLCRRSDRQVNPDGGDCLSSRQERERIAGARPQIDDDRFTRKQRRGAIDEAR